MFDRHLPDATPGVSGLRPAILAALVVLSLLTAGVTVGAAQGEVFAVEQTPLDEPATADRFDEDGLVRANVTTLDLTVAVAQDHEDLGIEGGYIDTNQRYVCLDYRESVGRTIRVEVPDDYVAPRPGIAESVTSDHTAQLQPTEDGNATAMTVQFGGQARPCFRFKQASGWYFSARDEADDILNETTGVGLPSLTGSEQPWQYVEAGTFANATTHRIGDGEHEYTVEFDAEAGENRTWLAVPDCDDPSEQRVCKYPADRANATYVLMTTADDPPPIRYRQGGPGATGVFGGGLSDIGQAIDAFLEDVAGLFGGDG